MNASSRYILRRLMYICWTDFIRNCVSDEIRYCVLGVVKLAQVGSLAHSVRIYPGIIYLAALRFTPGQAIATGPFVPR